MIIRIIKAYPKDFLTLNITIKGDANKVNNISAYNSQNQGKQTLQSSCKCLNPNQICHITLGQSCPLLIFQTLAKGSST
jgi:hypothetical protein